MAKVAEQAYERAGMSGAGLLARDVRPGCLATLSGAACAEQHIHSSRIRGACNGQAGRAIFCAEDKENSLAGTVHPTELNAKQLLRPPPCSRPRCRARRLHLKQQTRRYESAIVRLIMHSWRACAKHLAARRAKLERCLATSVETRERMRLRAWQDNVQQAWLQALPRSCAAVAAVALLEAVSVPAAYLHLAPTLCEAASEADVGPTVPESPQYHPFEAPPGTPQYRPFQGSPCSAAGPEPNATRRGPALHGPAPIQGPAPVLDEVRVAVGQLAVWMQRTSAWAPAQSEPSSLQPSPQQLSRANRAASAAASPCALLPHHGLAPRRLLMVPADAMDSEEGMPAWLQSAAEAVLHPNRAPPALRALACARRWAVENAVLIARQARLRAAWSAWEDAPVARLGGYRVGPRVC
jgi:hypothetical protein